MVRNISGYNRHVKKHLREYPYRVAMRALREGRDNNPAHEEIFNSLISGFKKKNQRWDRTG